MEQYILISAAFEGKVVITKDGKNLQANFTESSVTVGQQKFVLSMMQQGIPAMMEHFNGPNSDSKFEKLIIDPGRRLRQNGRRCLLTKELRLSILLASILLLFLQEHVRNMLKLILMLSYGTTK